MSSSLKRGDKKICPVRVGKQAKILLLLSDYKTIRQIAKETKTKENSVYRAFKRYITKGYITQDRTLTSQGLAIIKNCPQPYGLYKSVQSDMVRGHNIVFTLQVPKIKNWNKRRQFLEEKKIEFKRVGVNWEGERIIIDKTKIWFTPSSIVFYMPHFLGKDAYTVFRSATEYLLETLIPLVERTLSTNLRQEGGYKLRVSKQHYGLVKNALAEQYHNQRKKLFVRDQSGLWLLIDNSLNLKELETVHSKTAREDNIIVQDFFNDLKENPIVPSEIKGGFLEFHKALNVMAVAFAKYDKNIEKHLAVLDKMSETLDKIKERIK